MSREPGDLLAMVVQAAGRGVSEVSGVGAIGLAFVMGDFVHVGSIHA